MKRYIQYTIVLLTLFATACDEKFDVADIPDKVIPSLNNYYLFTYNKEHTFAANANKSYYGASTKSQVYVESSENVNWNFTNLPTWITATPNSGRGYGNVELYAADNNTLNPRMSVFQLISPKNEEGWSASQTLSATQEAADPFIELSESSIDFSGVAQEKVISIKRNIPFSITKSADSDWLSYALNSDSTSITISVKAYVSSNYRERSGYLYFTQLNGYQECQMNIYQAPAEVSFFSSTTLEVGREHSMATVSFKAEADWEATTTSNFIQFISDGTTVNSVKGTKSDAAEFTIDIAGNSSSSRTGYVYLSLSAGSDTARNITRIYIEQEGVSLSINPYNLNFNSSLEETASATIKSNAEWHAKITNTSDSSWIHLSPRQGSGDGTINVSVDENPYETSRSCYINIICNDVASAISIWQSSRNVQINTSSPTFGASEADGSIAFTTNGVWSAETNADWITLGTTSGSPSDEQIILPISVTTNTTSKFRQGTITIKSGNVSKTINIYQEITDIIYENDKVSIGPNAGTASITFQSNKSWTAKFEPDVEWITVSPNSGTSESSLMQEFKIDVSVSANNTDNARQTKLIISSTDNSSTQEVEITQIGSEITTDRDSVAFGPASEYKGIYIYSNTQWEARVDDLSTSWLSVSHTTGGANSSSQQGYYTEIHVTENTDDKDREGRVIISTFRGDVEFIKVFQSKRYFEIDTKPVMDFDANGSSCTISITNATDSWQVSSDVDWISCSPQSGYGKRDVTITAKANPSRYSRNAVVTFDNKLGTSYKIDFKQRGRDITANEQGIEFFAKGGTTTTTVSADGEFTITTNDTWYEVFRIEGTNKVSFTLPENETGVARTGTVTVTLVGQPSEEETLSKTIKVIQHPYMNNINLKDYLGKEIENKVITGDGFTIKITTYTSDKNYNNQNGSINPGLGGYGNDKNNDKNGNGNINIGGYGDDKKWN